MDEQKKKKVLLAVLAVVGLGAGGYYGFIRDTEPAYVPPKRGEVKQRQRTVVDKSSQRTRRTTRKKRTQSAVEKLVNKRERTKVEPKKKTRRERGRKKGVKTKKKALIPSA